MSASAADGAQAATAARTALRAGWRLARSRAGACRDASEVDPGAWVAADVPGTAAGALANAELDYDSSDWWFQTRFAVAPATPGEELWLAFEGIATIFEVRLNGELICSGESMFARHEVDVTGRLCDENTLDIVCRALAPHLAERRRPRARWRTRLVATSNLRFIRTMLMGRTPGFAPGPAVVGPYREVALVRRHGVVLEDVRVRPTLNGDDGVIGLHARVRATATAVVPETLAVTVRSDEHDGGQIELELPIDRGADGAGELSGEVHVHRPVRWWPHTHGTPALYRVAISDGGACLYEAWAGFRSLRVTRDLAADGLALEVNGQPVFARGAVWTPADLRHPSAGRDTLRASLERVVAAGMNMVRVAGIGAYESPAFHDLCDELGILVWQDFMFANLDYPESDPHFMDIVRAEAEVVLAELAGRPSLAVLCGGSEVAQQVAMLGLDPGLASGPLFGELLPELIAAARVDAPYVPSAPWGGDLPFRPDRGVANYYGVGAYLRPLEDARRADVRFAAECLAFANVPDDSALAELGGGVVPAVHDPAWKAGVPRDAGAGWDFDDVRDHYLALIFAVDPVGLRSLDPERYRELSRAVTGEVMAEVLGEWRRAGSACSGALTLWLQDHRPGAGWGLLDHRGEPKVAYHHVRRVLATVAVWSTDEGLGGIVAHVANDTPAAVHASLRVSLYRAGEQLVGEARAPVELAPHCAVAHNVEALLGRFVDVSAAYRFGPPAQDLVVLSLERERDGAIELLSQAFRFPTGRPLQRESADRLGLVGELRSGQRGPCLAVSARRFAFGVRAELPGWDAADDAFGVEPGHERLIDLRPTADADAPGSSALTALNLEGRVPLRAAV